MAACKVPTVCGTLHCRLGMCCPHPCGLCRAGFVEGSSVETGSVLVIQSEYRLPSSCQWTSSATRRPLKGRQTHVHNKALGYAFIHAAGGGGGPLALSLQKTERKQHLRGTSYQVPRSKGRRGGLLANPFTWPSSDLKRSSGRGI